MPENKYEKEVAKTSLVTLAGNAVLSLAKLLAGVLAHSAALISDAANSITDCFSTVVVMVGVHISAQKSDKDHPYGHERMECIAALVLAATFIATAAVIGWQGVQKIIDIVNGVSPTAPTYLALFTALGCILVKGGLYLYTERQAKRLKSSALHGMAVDHLSDSLSSAAAAVGIVGGMCGILVLDPIASVLIALMIVKTAWNVCRIAIDQLVDKSADGESEAQITQTVLATEGVERIDVLRTRQYGNKIFVDLEIAVAPTLSLIEAHRIAERVHERVEHGALQDVKHCMVHVNPLTEDDHHETPEEQMH